MRSKQGMVYGAISMIIAIAVMCFILYNGGNSKNEESHNTNGTTIEANADNNVKQYFFRNNTYLKEHFEKHGGEFSYKSAEEYAAGANRVINSKKALHKIETEDGDDVYYLEESNEFVIVSKDGYIRTYFKPDKGIDYYNRQ